MYTEEYAGINSFLVGASRLLLKDGVKRETRGKTCYELPEPFMFKITNPKARLITIPERGWNVALAYAESLWLACGRNDLGFIQNYLSRMADFSDDGLTLRGGYGPRLRKYNGNANDYQIINSADSIEKYRSNSIDQLDFVFKCFEKDENIRQAIITIGDPVKDSLDMNSALKQTKDFPCTRSLQFMKQPNSNKLNLTVYMRSNDILWGASAVNIFNFTFMQEYMAHLLGLEVGDYYHIANNFHFYEDQKEKIEKVAAVSEFTDESFDYNYSFSTLSEFDKQIRILEIEESEISEKKALYDFKDDFFNDWYKVLYHKRTKRQVEFVNPILYKIKTRKIKAMDKESIKKITNEVTEILLKKNEDYGGASFDLGLNGNMVHLWDKVRRYRSLIEKTKEKPNFEGLDDTLKDIIGYAIIGLHIFNDEPIENKINGKSNCK